MNLPTVSQCWQRWEAGVPPRTKLQLVKGTAKHLRSVQKKSELIRKYFEHDPVRYVT